MASTVRPDRSDARSARERTVGLVLLSEICTIPITLATGSLTVEGAERLRQPVRELADIVAVSVGCDDRELARELDQWWWRSWPAIQEACTDEDRLAVQVAVFVMVAEKSESPVSGTAPSENGWDAASAAFTGELMVAGWDQLVAGRRADCCSILGAAHTGVASVTDRAAPGEERRGGPISIASHELARSSNASSIVDLVARRRGIDIIAAATELGLASVAGAVLEAIALDHGDPDTDVVKGRLGPLFAPLDGIAPLILADPATITSLGFGDPPTAWRGVWHQVAQRVVDHGQARECLARPRAWWGTIEPWRLAVGTPTGDGGIASRMWPDWAGTYGELLGAIRAIREVPEVGDGRGMPLSAVPARSR